MVEKYRIKNTDRYYTLGDNLYDGGFGEIYECKIFNEKGEVEKGLVAKKLKDSTNMSIPHRFEREMRYIEQLDHKNVIKPVYCDYDNDFIVMKRYPGNLKNFIMENDYDETKLLEIYLVILEAMKYVVSEGIYHRDLKPQNILMTENHEPILTDFGLSSRVFDEDTKFNLTKTGFYAGTEMYTAPEQLQELKSADELSEVYSLGIILYSIFSKNFMNYSDDVVSDISNSRIRYIIRNSTRNNPNERVPSIEELYRQIERLLNLKRKSNIKNLEIDSIIQRLDDSISVEDNQDIQEILNSVNDEEFEKNDNLLVRLSMETHRYLILHHTKEYNEFIIKTSTIIRGSGYIFSYVDSITNAIIILLKKLDDELDIAPKIELITATIKVSTNHNRFYSMREIGDYINSLEDELLLDDISESVEIDTLKTLKGYASGSNINNLIKKAN